MEAPTPWFCRQFRQLIHVIGGIGGCPHSGLISDGSNAHRSDPGKPERPFRRSAPAQPLCSHRSLSPTTRPAPQSRTRWLDSLDTSFFELPGLVRQIHEVLVEIVAIYLLRTVSFYLSARRAPRLARDVVCLHSL